jgi:tRNA A37 threonylcarbamoyladenosine dehydratase
MYERIKDLLDLEKLKKANILLVGVGGVGSACFEVLIRSGVQNITIIDFDSYEDSNLNRQLNSNLNVIGKKKVEVLYNHAKSINKDINIEIRDEFLKKDSIINYKKYDYIIDACDSIEAKILLITKAYENDVKIVSSLGVGNRVNPSDLSINTLNKTVNDPLGKKLRQNLRKIGFKSDVKVVSSKELPIKKTPVSSFIGVSSYAGILLADFVIKEVVNNGSK